MKTIEEYREVLGNIAFANLSIKGYPYSPVHAIKRKEISILNEALDELEQYRINPPLTFEDIKIGDWVWYDKPVRVDRGYYKIIDIDIDNKRYVLSRQSSLGIVLDVHYKEDSFFAKEVKE